MAILGHMTSPGEMIEVDLDSRQRLSLARIIHSGQHRFRVEALSGGEYLLSPITSVSARELAMLRNPEAVSSLKAGIDQAAEQNVSHCLPGHFSNLSADLGIGEG